MQVVTPTHPGVYNWQFLSHDHHELLHHIKHIMRSFFFAAFMCIRGCRVAMHLLGLEWSLWDLLVEVAVPVSATRSPLHWLTGFIRARVASCVYMIEHYKNFFMQGIIVGVDGLVSVRVHRKQTIKPRMKKIC